MAVRQRRRGTGVEVIPVTGKRKHSKHELNIKWEAALEIWREKTNGRLISSMLHVRVAGLEKNVLNMSQFTVFNVNE